MPIHIKQPPTKSLNKFASKKISDAYQLTGKALPCTVVKVAGAIVTVSFDVDAAPWSLPQITVPVASPIYIRLPIQKGDRGGVIPFDVYLGGASGLGGGTANLSQRANLSTGLFVPIGSALWAAVNANILVLQGPDGTTIQQIGSPVSLTANGSGVVINLSGGTVAVNGGNVVVTGGDVIADGYSLKTHLTTGVTAGGDLSGPPEP